MNRILSVLIFIIGFGFSASAQDLIVTSEGDSLNCVITKVKKNCIYFTFMHEDKVTSTLLPNDRIASYQEDYFDTGEVDPEQMTRYADFPHIRLVFNGGYSRQTAKLADDVPSDLKSYQKQLKTGAHIGAEAYYYFYESLGAGGLWNMFTTSNSMDGAGIVDEFGAVQAGKLKDNITVHFFAPAFSARLMNHNKTNSFLLNLAIGYVGYRNEQTVLSDNYDITASTLGVQYSMGYDYGISEKLAVGLQASLFAATLNEYDIDNGKTLETVKLEEGEYIGLSRIDLSIGLRFNL